MKKLIKNGDIILDGKLTRKEKEIEAFCKLGFIEELMEKHKIMGLEELDLALHTYHTFMLYLTEQNEKEKKL